MKYIKSSKIVSREINGEVLILNTENNSIYSLNKSASYIWNNMESQLLDTMVRTLSQKYNEDSKIILKDVQELIKSLLEKKLLVEKSE